MRELTDLGITAIRDGVAKGDFTATEVATAFNAAVAEANPALNAFILTTPDHALAAAAKVDAARARGVIRTASYAQVTEPIYRHAAGRWHRYAGHLAAILPVLEPWIRRWGYAPPA